MKHFWQWNIFCLWWGKIRLQGNSASNASPVTCEAQQHTLSSEIHRSQSWHPWPWQTACRLLQNCCHQVAKDELHSKIKAKQKTLGWLAMLSCSKSPTHTGAFAWECQIQMQCNGNSITFACHGDGSEYRASRTTGSWLYLQDLLHPWWSTLACSVLLRGWKYSSLGTQNQKSSSQAWHFSYCIGQVWIVCYVSVRVCV